MAVIEGSVAGGKWNEGGAWVGGVVPGEADDVILPATAGSITVSTVDGKCRSCDATNYAKTLTLTTNLKIGAATAHAEAFALKLGAGQVLAGAGEIQLVSSSATVLAILLKGKKLVGKMAFTGTGSWKFTEKVESAAAIELTAGGKLNTNGQEVICKAFQIKSTASVELGASKVVCNGTTAESVWEVAATATLTAGTSTLEITGAGVTPKTFKGGGKTYNTLIITAPNLTITDSNTYDKLTFNTFGQANGAKVEKGTTQTITTTFATNGTAANKVKIESTEAGKSFTFSKAAGDVYAEGLLLKDVKAAGGVLWWAGAGSVSTSGNEGWKFEAATITASAAGGKWSEPKAWSPEHVPTINDDVVLAAASGSIEISASAGARSLRTEAYAKTLTHTAGTLSLGNGTAPPENWLWKWTAGTFTANGGEVTVGVELAAVNQKIQCGGQTWRAFVYQAPGSTVFLEDELKVKLTLTHEQGTLNTKGNTQTWGTYVGNVSSARTLTLESSTIKINGTEATTGWRVLNPTGMTLNAGTSTIEMNGTGLLAKQFTGGGKTYNNVIFAADNIGVADANTFANLTLNLAGTTKAITFTKSQTTTITGTLTTNAKAGSVVKIASSTIGTFFTFSKTSGLVNLDYLELKDTHASGGAEWYAGPLSHSTNVSGNEGWKFEAIFQPTVTQSSGATLTRNVTRLLPVSAGSTPSIAKGVGKNLSVTQASSASKVAALTRALSITQGQAATVVLALPKGLVVSQAQAAVVKVGVGRILTVGQNQTASLGAVLELGGHERTLSVGQGSSAAVRLSLARTLSAMQGASAAAAVAATRALTASQASSATSRVAVGRVLTVGQAQDPKKALVIARTLVASSSQVITVVFGLTFSLTLSASQASSAALRRALGRTLSTAQPSSATISRALVRTMVLGQGQAPLIVRALARGLATTQGATATLGKATARTLSVAQGSSAGSARSLALVFATTQTSTATVLVKVTIQPVIPLASSSTSYTDSLTSVVSSSSGVTSAAETPVLASTVESSSQESSVSSPLIESSVD